MMQNAIERFSAVIGNRRILVGGGLAALVLAAVADNEGEAAHRRRKRRRQRHQRRQRRRRHHHDGGSAPGDALTCYVCEKMTDFPSCRFTSIQTAIDSAGDGDIIVVCPGTFKERLTFSAITAPNITILGQGSEETTLDADNEGSAITLTRAAFVEIQRFTITGGKATAGGGIHNQGFLTLQDCVITENESEGPLGGGGIYNSGTLSLSLVTISDNDADDGGNGGGIFNAGGTVTVDEISRITGNKATQGGGIFSQGGTVSVSGNSTVTGNKPNNCAGTDACPA